MMGGELPNLRCLAGQGVGGFLCPPVLRNSKASKC